MAELGQLIVIRSHGAPIAACVSTDIDHSADTIPISSPLAGDYANALPGIKSWRVTSNHLVTNMVEFVMAVGSTVELNIHDRNLISGYNNLSGMAIVTRAQITAQTGKVVKGSFTFTGTGPLTPSRAIGEAFTLDHSLLDSTDVLQ